MKKVVNPSANALIPSQFKTKLANLYRDDINWLAQRYGSYAHKWALEVEEIITGK